MKNRGFWGEAVRQAALGGGLLCLWVALAGAQTLTVSGSPSAMKITSATAGLPPNDATNTATTYSAKTNNKNPPKEDPGGVNPAHPAWNALTGDLGAPGGAGDDGVFTLDATAREV